MDLDIPYIDIDDTMASLRQALAKDAHARLERRDWQSPELVRDLTLWKQRIMQTDDPAFMQWCWLSTAFSAPSWSRMTPAQIKEWTPVWLHFLEMDEASWVKTEPLENGRLETQWIRHLRDVVHTQSAQPLLDWWKLRENIEGHDGDHDFFWKAAHATLANTPDIAESLTTAWISELKLHRVDPALLFDWSICVARTMAAMPADFRHWLRELLRQDAPATRLIQFRQQYETPSWQDSLTQEVLHGVCSQEHSTPWPLVPTNIQNLWNNVPLCSYPVRLDIAKNFLESKDLFSSSERWPLDYPAMERAIHKAAPDADLSQWGTAPWLAGLLHVLPEFATVLLFHDVLPVSPAQAHALVLLYKDNCDWAKHPDLYPFSSELFENDSSTI
jgi:hypothetical protein